MKKLLIVVLWVGCGYYNWGMTLGYFTHRYPEQDHVGFSLFMAANGPFGLVVSSIMMHPAHWQTKPYTVEQRWQAFQAQYPSLDRAYFERNDN